MSKSLSTITINGEKYKLLPLDFVEKIGTVILNQNQFEHHIIVAELQDKITKITTRGLHEYKDAVGKYVSAFAVTDDEINWLRDNYNKTMENII